jgi:hypothetical protein
MLDISAGVISKEDLFGRPRRLESRRSPAAQRTTDAWTVRFPLAVVALKWDDEGWRTAHW